jgi:exodeoxyribonuclease-5
MTTLTADQEQAKAKFQEFLKNDEATAFLLEGGAGVGKTFLVGQLLLDFDGSLCVCTPTHKATNVIRRKLDAFGIDWTRGYDPYSYHGECVTGTTAQLLGIGPVVTEDQDSKKVKFGRANKGILSKFTPRLLVIDEVSMLGWNDFRELMKHGKASGMKILAVGDAGQLPPVQAERIPFEKFVHKATLRQVVRQAEGSAIIQVGWAIREDQSWRDIHGPGVRVESRLQDAFLEAVQAPGERPEEEREVFIAYRNVVVNTVQEAACQKLYGHGRKEFAPGELVLSETNLYRAKTLLCANQDELVVVEFHEDERDEQMGVPVTLRHRRSSTSITGSFRAHYLSPEELADPKHPYNVELKRLEAEAQELQAQVKAGAKHLDSQRRQAWVNFFSWRDTTVISFRHPFAITSHKSQGSTYRAVFVAANDFAKFGKHGLYVAVTRPKEELVYC